MSTQAKVGDKWYRFEYITLSEGYDEYSGRYHSRVELQLSTVEVTKLTPNGVWVQFGNKYSENRRKFINHSWRKKYAHPTKVEALQSFAARKRQHMGILSAQIQNVRRALAKAEALLTEVIGPPNDVCPDPGTTRSPPYTLPPDGCIR